jgi:hypothetical protein
MSAALLAFNETEAVTAHLRYARKADYTELITGSLYMHEKK